MEAECLGPSCSDIVLKLLEWQEREQQAGHHDIAHRNEKENYKLLLAERMLVLGLKKECQLDDVAMNSELFHSEDTDVASSTILSPGG